MEVIGNSEWEGVSRMKLNWTLQGGVWGEGFKPKNLPWGRCGYFLEPHIGDKVPYPTSRPMVSLGSLCNHLHTSPPPHPQPQAKPLSFFLLSNPPPPPPTKGDIDKGPPLILSFIHSNVFISRTKGEIEIPLTSHNYL